MGSVGSIHVILYIVIIVIYAALRLYKASVDKKAKVADAE